MVTTLLNATLARVDRHVAEWLTPAMVIARHAVNVSSWAVPGEPVPWAAVKHQEFAPTAAGDNWGEPWSTYWFRLEGQIPEEWSSGSVELEVDLGFTHSRPGFQCEGTVWTPDGRVERAIEPMNRRIPLRLEPGDRLIRFVEASANPNLLFAEGDVAGIRLMSTPTQLGDVRTAPSEPLYRFGGAWLQSMDYEVQALIDDIRSIAGIARSQPEDGNRALEIERALRQMLVLSDPDNIRGTVPAARSALSDVLSRPTGSGGHQIVAVGHAHIDSAWLWPARETRRKAARTFANALALMDTNPDFVFAASSAQQYAWVEEDYPELFARIKRRVEEGRFIPVGGMWVEPDTNLPSGESLIRQFVEGTSYFLEKFGYESDEVWLPDSFGYSAALPQIAASSGKQFLLAQKLSWNDTNRFPATSFWWEGHNGTRIFTHMPSVDIYNAELSAADLLRSQDQYADKGRGNLALVPFGYGDGGGGPTRDMLAAAARARDVDGLPRVQLGTPQRFFKEAREQISEPRTWVGELYLEFHRGTYTSQHAMKEGNRRCEHLLQQAEAACAAAAIFAGMAYPADEFRTMWRQVLLGQFHDVLPGTSIAWVHREAREMHDFVSDQLSQLIRKAERVMAQVQAPVQENEGLSVEDRLSVEVDGRGWTLSNASVRVHVNTHGLVDSVLDLEAGREVVPPGAEMGLLQLHRDIPSIYEAWELESSYRDVTISLSDVDSIEVINRPDIVGVVVCRTYGLSTFTQTISISPGTANVEFLTDVNWRHRHTLLKLSFAVDVAAERVAYEMQHGFVERSITSNTSWEQAKYEVVAHRYVRVAEPGYGVALVNDTMFGHDASRRSRRGGGSATEIRQTLLRSPQHPDPETDQGDHSFRAVIVPGASTAQAAREGRRLAQLPEDPSFDPLAALITLSTETVMVDVVKLAFDGSGDVVVRLYEGAGTRTALTLTNHFDALSVTSVDVLERPTAAPLVEAMLPQVHLELSPFELITLRFRHGRI